MLNPEFHRQVIHTQGESVRWLQALPTSSYDPKTNYEATGTPAATVENGYNYREPLAGTELRALIVTAWRNVNSPEQGWIRVGELTVTTMPDEIPLGDGDKLVLCGREETTKERLSKGTDSFAQPYPVSVQTVADDTRVYVLDTDYTVNLTTKKIVWIAGGHAPTTATPYAVSYSYNPVYWYVTGRQTNPRPTGLTDTRMPLRGVLTLQMPGA